MRIAQDNTGTNLTYPNLLRSCSRRPHTPSPSRTHGHGNSSNFFFPQLQLVNITPTDNAGIAPLTSNTRSRRHQRVRVLLLHLVTAPGRRKEAAGGVLKIREVSTLALP